MVLTRSMIKQRGIAIEPVKWEEPRKSHSKPSKNTDSGINYINIFLKVTALAITLSIGLYTRSVYGFVIPVIGLQLCQMAMLA